MVPDVEITTGVCVAPGAVFRWLTDPTDPTRIDRGHVLLLEEGDERIVVKLIPRALAAHAEQEARVLHSLGSFDLAVPRLVKLPTGISANHANWCTLATRFIRGDHPSIDSTGTPGLFCSIVASLAAADRDRADSAGQLVFAQRMTQWLSPRGLPIVTLGDHKNEIRMLSEMCAWNLDTFFREAEERLDWLDALPLRLVHNDINRWNVVLQSNSLGVLDFGCAVRSSPFVDFGGIVSHLGTEHLDAVVQYCTAYFDGLSVEKCRLACRYFTAKRALRRLCYLTLLPARDEATLAGIERASSILMAVTSVA